MAIITILTQAVLFPRGKQNPRVGLQSFTKFWSWSWDLSSIMQIRGSLHNSPKFAVAYVHFVAKYCANTSNHIITPVVTPQINFPHFHAQWSFCQRGTGLSLASVSCLMETLLKFSQNWTGVLSHTMLVAPSTSCRSSKASFCSSVLNFYGEQLTTSLQGN